MSKHSHVQIDDSDPEGTHLWVQLHKPDGRVDQIVGQYPVEQRQQAHEMARNLARALNLPLKLNRRQDEPDTIWSPDREANEA
jgi:hypothetical protein